ncbi:MAG: DUF4349 domain-containing protein [Clostridia bacterium]|nr:DUF4349 domain-containing protein [Clostridia bacterium]
MNKKEYIKAVDNITAPKELLDKIEALQLPPKKKKSVLKTVTTIAACFVAVILAFSGIMGGTLKASESDRVYNYGSSYNNVTQSYAPESMDFTEDVADSVTDASSAATADRKIIKTAQVRIKTRNYDTLMSDIKQKIEQYGGYIEQSQEYNYDSASNRNANMDVKIPADKLEQFIEELEGIGTVISKVIASDDITDSYIDVESRINALETEEKTLLGILEKAENLTDVIELQNRLSAVRSDLESMKAKKQHYDGMVAYSGISLDINEVERVVEGDDTFFGEVKERLMNNLYDLGDFLCELTISLIASLPYIAIVGVIAAVVIIIIKKSRKR